MSAPEPAATPVPTCYRHPGTETYIRCTRCERPICPQCMIPASVGFQCPECVREGSRTVRAPRTVFGGRVSADPAYVTKAIITLTLAVFVLQLVTAGRVTALLALTAYEPPFRDPGGVAGGEWWRLVTVMLVHADRGLWLAHVALNMYALWLLGPPLEAVLGRLRFLLLYVVSGLGGSLASYAFSDVRVASVGASGAIFGLFGAMLVVNRRRGRENGGLWGVLLLNVVAGFAVAGIDWRAHLGGCVAGAAVAAVFAYAPAGRVRAMWHAAGIAAIVVVLLAGTAARTAQIRAEADQCARLGAASAPVLLPCVAALDR